MFNISYDTYKSYRIDKSDNSSRSLFNLLNLDTFAKSIKLDSSSGSKYFFFKDER